MSDRPMEWMPPGEPSKSPDGEHHSLYKRQQPPLSHSCPIHESIVETANHISPLRSAPRWRGTVDNVPDGTVLVFGKTNNGSPHYHCAGYKLLEQLTMITALPVGTEVQFGNWSDPLKGTIIKIKIGSGNIIHYEVVYWAGTTRIVVSLHKDEVREVKADRTRPLEIGFRTGSTQKPDIQSVEPFSVTARSHPNDCGCQACRPHAD
jgi:hypothetical protein